MRRRARTPYLAAAAAALALAAAACSIAPSASEPSPLSSPHGPPLSASPPARTDRAVSPFAALAGYLASRDGQVTAAVFDARTGRTWVYHPGVLEHTASLVKVQIMGTAMRQAEEKGMPVPPDQVALMTPMIQYSDNTAATELLADVGGASAVRHFDRLAGLNHTYPSSVVTIPGTPWPGWGLTTTTARDQVTLISRFAYPNSVLSASDRAFGLRLMEHVEAGQNWGVSGGVPADTTIALKNGWIELPNEGWQINSIGWINGGGRDYVLAVLTAYGPTEQYGIDTIEAIARHMFAVLGPKPAG